MKVKQCNITGIELTTFKIKGCTFLEFIKANASIDVWLKQQPGFCSRHMVEKEDNTIVDLLHWTSVEQGTDAMHRIMTETANSKVHSLIDHRTVQWNIFPVQHTVS